jgi:monovalent cation:H+ antiporter, CPA1 family
MALFSCNFANGAKGIILPDLQFFYPLMLKISVSFRAFMTAFDIMAIVLTLAGLFGYVNHRFIKLPANIGLMLIALVVSLALIFLRHLGINMDFAEKTIHGIDFDKTLMQGMLGFLLFAGALNVNLEDLLMHKWTVALFTVFGVLCSTAIIGGLGYVFFAWAGLPLPLIYCFLFGALISPTDPIAVLSMLKELRAPKTLEIKIAGEALFNDGVGVVVFLALLEVAAGQGQLDLTQVGLLFLKEAVGGICLGLLLGWITFRLLKSIDHYQVEVMLTLGLVTGSFALANALHASGPLATVTAGILIGNHGRRFAMSEKTREQINTFWELIDEILNAVLFVLIGLEVLALKFETNYWAGIAIAVPVVLVARLISVSIPSLALRTRRSTPHLVKIMTWGGLRGGISVALALSLPMGPERNFIVTVTYAIVVFSILIQGLTTPMLLRRLLKN